MTEHWVDVSHWQGIVNWNVCAPKVDGAIIKMSEYEEDDQYRRNVDECKSRGKRFAVYHFWHDHISVKTQIDLIQKLNTYGAPVALNVEGKSYQLANIAKRSERLMALCYALKDAGFLPTMYTRKTIWDQHITASILWQNFPLWVANYGVTKPALPRDWTKWYVWQYSNTGKGTDYGINPVSNKFIDLDTVKQEWIDFYWPTVVPPPEPPPPPVETGVPEVLTGTVGDKTYTWRLE